MAEYCNVLRRTLPNTLCGVEFTFWEPRGGDKGMSSLFESIRGLRTSGTEARPLI